MASSSSRAAGDGSGGPLMGSVYTSEGLRRSARIAALQKVLPGVESATTGISDKEIDDMANDLATQLNIAGGSKKLRRLRGGGVVEEAKAKAAFAKSVAMMTVYTITDIAAIAVKEGADPARHATTIAVEYLTRELTPLGGAGVRFVSILAGLANQLFRAGVTLVMLPVATAGFTANFISKVISNFNDWGRSASAELLGDAKAIAAANAAVGSLKQAGVTAGIGLVVANQVGLLPMSALLAAILFSIQVNIGTGVGRGYVVAGFYAWYLGQSAAKRAEINAAAKQYADSASSAAAGGAVAAARTLAPLLATAAAATAEATTAATKAGIAAMTGKNAFQAVAAGAAAANAEVVAPGSRPAATQDISSEAAVNAALTAATRAAAIAASKAEDAAPGAAVGAPGAEVGPEDGAASAASSSSSSSAAPVAVGLRRSRIGVGSKQRRYRDEDEDDELVASSSSSGPGAAGEGLPEQGRRKQRRGKTDLSAASEEFIPGEGKGGRRKTKKGKSKRRVTRRRKAQKIMGTPVFIY